MSNHFALFKYWSENLSPFLEKPSNEVCVNLFRLFDSYQTGKIEDILTVLNCFQVFPGYPFLTETSFTRHIRYIGDYLSLIVEKEIPKVPFFAFHKTASSYISVVLCRMLNIEPTMLSFEHLKGVPAWINAFAKWGGVTHDHYYPSPDNLQLLFEAGIKKCIVHHRQPMNVLISYGFHYLDQRLIKPKKELKNEADRIAAVRDYLENEMERIITYYGTWNRLWRHEEQRGRFEILHTYYEDMQSDQQKFFKKILNFCEISYDESHLEKILIELTPKQKANNFNYRKALSTEWKEVLTKGQIEKATWLINKEFPNSFL